MPRTVKGVDRLRFCVHRRFRMKITLFRARLWRQAKDDTTLREGSTAVPPRRSTFCSRLPYAMCFVVALCYVPCRSRSQIRHERWEAVGARQGKARQGH